MNIAIAIAFIAFAVALTAIWVASEVSKNPDKVFDVDLTYLTSRGNWFFTSWKGYEDKSGGIATNIGVHFYDMLSWVFGDVKKNETHLKQDDANAGYLEFKHARVRWFLSVNYDYIPEEVKLSGQRTYRSITVDGDEIEFSDGFFDLHTASYDNIVKGKGFGLNDARQSIEIVHDIRVAELSPMEGDYHPLAKLSTTNHPFKSGSNSF